MKRGYKFWILNVITAILLGLAIWGLSSLICIAVTHQYLNEPELVQTARAARMFMGIALALTAWLWYMTIVLHRCHKKDEVRAKELERAHTASQKQRGAYTATLYDMIDDNGGKEFFTIYGEKVRSGAGEGPVCTLFRLLAILCTMFTITICIIVICMMMSVMK
ncbi:MAG: hypothetical protein ACI38A_08440 [Candidatus Ornithomonoglobus sp.]